MMKLLFNLVLAHLSDPFEIRLYVGKRRILSVKEPMLVVRNRIGLAVNRVLSQVMV